MLIPSACARFIIENWDNIWCSLIHLKKSVMRLQITIDTSIPRLLKIKMSIFWINAHTPIEYTPIHLESNGQHIKVPLIFWFLIMIFCFCFYHQLWVKWLCIDIGNSSGHIGQTHLRFRKYLWMFDTEWNAHQIDIFDNLFN